MAASTFYKKNITGGGIIFIISILWAITARILFFFSLDESHIPHTEGGYLWSYVSPYFASPFLLLIGGVICITLVLILISYINTSNLLLRKQSLFPIALTLLLFSSHPSFLIINSDYIGLLLFLIFLSGLFKSYQHQKKQAKAINISIILALGSLFSPILTLYFLVLFIGLGVMQILNFKSFIASILGFFSVYALFFFVFFIRGEYSPLCNYLLSIVSSWNSIPILTFTPFNWTILSVAILLLSISFSRNYISRHKDKIKTRGAFSFLFVIAIYAILLLLFVNIQSQTNYYVLIIVGALLMSHLFVLSDAKSTEILLYISFIFYIAVLFYNFS